MAVAPPRLWIGPWVALSVIWGFSFVFIKVCASTLDAYQTTFGRLGLGAVVLLGYLALRRMKPVTDLVGVGHLAIVGMLAQAVPFSLFAWAEHQPGFSSVAAGLVNSTMTLWTALLAIMLLPDERLDRIRATGLAVGAIGVVVLLGVWGSSFAASWTAYAACTMATLGYSVAGMWTRKFIMPRGYNPISAVATQLSAGALMEGVVVAFVSDAPTEWPLKVVGSLLALGALGTGVALVLNFVLIRVAGAVITSTVTYSIPIVATIAGAVLLREEVHWYEPVGAAIILLGIAMVQGYLPRPKADHSLALPPEAD